ncbi:Ig-like domain-containing protein [Roseivivax sp. CAU 1761]
MARTLAFTVSGDIDTHIFVEEGDFDGDGFTDLRFTVSLDESGGKTGDLRGLFWDAAGDDTTGWGVWAPGSPDVTDEDFRANKVSDLGNGANMNGKITNKGKKFDAGVELGTPGIGKDDIKTTSFVVTAGSQDLTLDDIGGMRFGVRITSFGEIGGSREGSLKIAGVAPHAPDALDDALTTDEDSVGMINILANDSDDDGDPLTVTAIEGGTVGVPYLVTSDGGRDALVTVAADGSMSVDPSGNFEDLTTGETDTFTLIYHISDGAGGTDCAEIAVTIEGVNDAPVANPDVFFVEPGDHALVDVAANDTDVDGMVDPTTMLFFGAAGLAVTLVDKLSYHAPDIGGDLVDDSFNDTFIYTIEDLEGLASAPGDVTAKVIDPLIETDVDAAAAASNGQLLSLSLETEDRTFNTSSHYDLSIVAGSVDQAVNVSFVIDGSGSVSGAQYNQQRLAVQNAINDLRASFAANPDADVEVQLVQFASSASAASYDLFSSVLDNVASGTPISSQLGGATNYEAALDLAVDFFTGQGGDDNFMLFASDGLPNVPSTSFANFTDEVAELEALNVDRTAVGFGGASAAALNAVDSGGNATIVATAADLGDVFAGAALFPADLLDFSLKVDGTEVADETDLIPLGGGDYALAGFLTGLDNTHLATNTVEAVAQFDTDNDGMADETRTATTVIDGTDGSDVLFV